MSFEERFGKEGESERAEGELSQGWKLPFLSDELEDRLRIEVSVPGLEEEGVELGQVDDRGG